MNTRDLEAALREARVLCESHIRLADRRKFEDAWSLQARSLLARIDAALSTVSGEASGGDEGLATADDVKGILGPAPSEAMNMGRARDIDAELFWMRDTGNGDAREELKSRKSRLLIFQSALDSARAEGIAAERERCAKIADAWANGSGAEHGIAKGIASAIRAGDKS